MEEAGPVVVDAQEALVERLLEIAGFVGAGAAGAAIAVVTFGGDLTMILPVALLIGLGAVAATSYRGRR